MTKSRSGLSRRIATGVLASALAVVGIALAPPVGAVEDVEAGRLNGATRYGTAAAIAVGNEELEIDAFEGASTVILATGENFPDALAASGLAGANAPAPILLTPTDDASEETTSALEELGITNIIIVGGTSAVSENVADFYTDEGYSVTRVAGDNRYETAAEIAGDITPADLGGLSTAIIATGENYPDALAGGPLAYSGPYPVLLVNSDGIPSATEAALDGIEQVVILGGTGVVSADTEAELEEMTGNDAVRLAGTNRFGTAAEIGDYLIETVGFAATTAIIASGVNFPDALAGGPLGGEIEAPIVLTASLPAESADFLDRWSGRITQLAILGGPAAVDDVTAAEAEGEAENIENDDASGDDVGVVDAPELTGTEIRGIDLEDDFVALIAFCFDEPLDDVTVDEDDFKLYDPDTNEFADGSAAELEEAAEGEDPSCVLVTFSVLDPIVTRATVAAVEQGAVQDTDGNTNPEGWTEGLAQNESGEGRAPDLVSVEITDADTNEVTFTFDDVVGAIISSAGFDLVKEDGTEEAAPLTATIGDDSISVVTTWADLTDPDAVRGVVNSGSVAGAGSGGGGTTVFNELDTAPVDGGSDNTDDPDLVGVELDEEDDLVIYTFDQNIETLTTAGSPTSFQVAYASCEPAGTTPCVASSSTAERTGNREVTAAFPEGAIHELVMRGMVLEGAVADDTTNTLVNHEDSVDIARSWEAGQTLGPRLVDAETDEDRDVFDDLEALELVLTFDQEVDLSGGGSITIWSEAGENDTIALGDCEADDDEVTVTCSIDEDDEDDLSTLGEALANAVLVTIAYDTVDNADEVFVDGIVYDFPNHEDRAGINDGIDIGSEA